MPASHGALWDYARRCATDDFRAAERGESIVPPAEMARVISASNDRGGPKPSTISTFHKVRLVTQAAKVLFRQAPAPAGFAVVDVETTGLYPRTDRVVEVAVVHLSAEGQITAEFSTLINPGT
jgi:DNA polymerase III epsilon subunit-like protein